MLEWSKGNIDKPCYPTVNALWDYIRRSKVSGIRNAYREATSEVAEYHNALCGEIRKRDLHIEHITQMKSLTDVEIQANVKHIDCKKAALMDGRKEKYLHDDDVEKVKRMRADDMSFDEIGKVMGVSGRTIRRVIKGEAAYQKKD